MSAISKHNQSGGPAALPSNSNPNKTINTELPDTMFHHQTHNNTDSLNDAPVTLKKAAAKYNCAVSSLKNNAKSGNLNATQDDPKKPYMSRLCDVEKFLRDTPGIASVFHRKEKPSVLDVSDPKTPTPAPAGIDVTKQGDNSECKPTENEAHAEPLTNQNSEQLNTSAGELLPAESSVDAAVLTQEPTKRRRRRPRGKRGKNLMSEEKNSEASNSSPLAIKALEGTSPQDRLRLVACLNELVATVAMMS